MIGESSSTSIGLGSPRGCEYGPEEKGEAGSELCGRWEYRFQESPELTVYWASTLCKCFCRQVLV